MYLAVSCGCVDQYGLYTYKINHYMSIVLYLEWNGVGLPTLPSSSVMITAYTEQL